MHINGKGMITSEYLKQYLYRLLILRAGHGSEPLFSMVNTLGWKTAICDTRTSNLVYIKSAGLNLGGESPESIALSICAEIEADRNRATPMSLREKKRVAIHANEK